VIGAGAGPAGGVIVPPESAVYQLLTQNGDGTGNASMNIDSSGAPVKFFIQPPVGKKYTLKRMNLEAIDGSFNNATNYGDLTLTNGMRVYIEDDSGIIKEYTDGFTIKRSHDWALLSGVDAPSIGGAGADVLLVRWTFNNGCSPITLDGSKNERLVVQVNDNMLGLIDQLIQVQGCEGNA
jgi:hypothetical protein